MAIETLTGVGGSAVAARPVGVLRDVVEEVVGVAGGPLWACSGGELVEALGRVAAARHRLAVLERRLVAEGLERGLPAEAGASAVDWVVECERGDAPGIGVGHAASVIRLAQAQSAQSHPDVIARIDDAVLAPASADLLIRFHGEVERVADPVMLAELFTALVESASDGLAPIADPDRDTDGDTDSDGDTAESDESDAEEGAVLVSVRGLSMRQLKAYIAKARRMVKPAPGLDKDDDRYHDSRALFVRPGAAGLTELRWVMDPEAACTVEAALAGLSGPVPATDGTPDPRTPAQRRSDAMLALVTRALTVPPAKQPGQHATQVVVTMSYQHLVEQLRGAGLTATGHVLSPTTVRRLACDADIVPMILGTDGTPLDVGRTHRLFTPGQRHALAERDRGCTFPGCTAPPAWCQAHHIIHWLFGGPTDLTNAALLCGRHHRHVHARNLTATLTTTGIHWHT